MCNDDIVVEAVGKTSIVNWVLEVSDTCILRKERWFQTNTTIV